MEMNNAIALAVAPVKADAVKAAKEYATQYVERHLAKLAEVGMDAQVYAPYPKSTMRRPDYVQAHNLYTFIRRITESANTSGSRRINDPDPRVRDQEAIDAFIAIAERDAAFQYDAFVCKLVKKIGACETATLRGNHVWGHSYLMVTFSDKAPEVWKTQSIINVSKLGNVFNQWPTRKVKHA